MQVSPRLNPDLIEGDTVRLIGGDPFDGKFYTVERVTYASEELRFAAAPYTATTSVTTNVTVPNAEPKNEFTAGVGGEVNQMLFGVFPFDALWATGGTVTTSGARAVAGPIREISLSIGVQRAGQSPLFIDPQRTGGAALYPLHVETSPVREPNRRFADYAVKGDNAIALPARNNELFTIGSGGTNFRTSDGLVIDAAAAQLVRAFYSLYLVRFLGAEPPAGPYSVFKRSPAIQV